MKKHQLLIVLAIVLTSVILTTIFSKIQDRRIHQLRETLDSLQNGQEKALDAKYFNADSAQSANP